MTQINEQKTSMQIVDTFIYTSYPAKIPISPMSEMLIVTLVQVHLFCYHLSKNYVGPVLYIEVFFTQIQYLVQGRCPCFGPWVGMVSFSGFVIVTFTFSGVAPATKAIPISPNTFWPNLYGESEGKYQYLCCRRCIFGLWVRLTWFWVPGFLTCCVSTNVTLPSVGAIIFHGATRNSCLMVQDRKKLKKIRCPSNWTLRPYYILAVTGSLWSSDGWQSEKTK